MAERLSLVLLLVCLGLPGSAGALTQAYAVKDVTGPNNRQDVHAASCDPAIGCFDNTGARCAAQPPGRCDVQVTPAGRCSQGTGACIWPQGAGFCESSGGSVDPVACLTDAYVDYLQEGGTRPTAAIGASAMCQNVQGGTGLCDMSTHDPGCDCTGSDPGADLANTDDDVPSWEGAVCGSGQQSVCSDGDLRRSQVGFGTNICLELCVTVADCNPEPICGSQHTAPGAVVGVKYMSTENPDDFWTLQRRPGTGLTTPSSGPILPLNSTYAADISPVGEGDFAENGARRVRAFANSFHADERFNGAGVNGIVDVTGPTNYFCEVPLGQGWAAGQPVHGRCQIQSGVFCIADSDCTTPGDVCDPATFRYCHDNDSDPATVQNQAAVDGTGFVFTRPLEPGEQTGVCPPDCRTSYDYNTFEEEELHEAVASATSGDPRAGLQAAFDSLEGPRVTKGDAIFVQPIVSVNTLVLGDLRCYIGGDPTRPDPEDANIGRCLNGPTPCDPTQPINSNGCPSGDQCVFCHGTSNVPPHSTNATHATFGGAFGHDPVNGNALASPVGFQTHGHDVLSPLGRIGRINGVPSTTEVPVMLVLTQGAARSTFHDNDCGVGFDDCDLGQVDGGGPGIGAADTVITTGDPVPHEPNGPAYFANYTVDAEDPINNPIGLLVTTRDFGRGADGIPGCLGDNKHPNTDQPCTHKLASSTPGATGSDDLPIEYDYSEFGDGSDLRQGTRSRFGAMASSLAFTPTWTAASTFTGRDFPTGEGANPDGLDLVGKNEVSFCPILSRDGTTLHFETACLDSDLDGDGWLDEQDLCPLNPAFGGDASDVGGVATPANLPANIPDGIADGCQCGDVTNDGRVNGNDATLITFACINFQGFFPDGCTRSYEAPDPTFVWEKCDVGAGQNCAQSPGNCCNGNDATVITFSGLGFPPGVDNVCPAYNPGL